jgi:hypothetical protein
MGAATALLRAPRLVKIDPDLCLRHGDRARQLLESASWSMRSALLTSRSTSMSSAVQVLM